MEELDYRKIHDYCQFCLKLQTKDVTKMPINRKMKQDFQEFTNKNLSTKLFSEFICCQPCLDTFEFVTSYRAQLIENQKSLDVLQKKFKENILEVDDELDKSKDEEILVDQFILDESQIDFDESSSMIQEETFESEEYIEEEHLFEEAEEEEEEEIEVSLDSSSKKKYQRKRLKEPIKCPKCDRLFYYKSYFTFHHNDVHTSRAEVCHHCGKVFKNSRRLNSHILIHNVGEKRFKCEICNKEFNYSGDLLRHKRIHDNNKPFKCHFEDCGKSFVQSYALKLHLDVHNRVKFSCDKCGSQYSVKTTLKNHMQKCMNDTQNFRPTRYRHSNKKGINRERYKCFIETCDREFSSRKYLGVHLERQHKLKFQNFETTCLECQMVFDNSGDYAKHVKIHSCNFVCDLCKLRFKTDEKLQSHIEKHHKEGQDRPFICAEEDCGARFKRSEHLRGHQLYKHSDIKRFECQECPLKFRQRGEFNVHMRVHQDVKPFSCWKCEHVCKTSSNLRQHMRLVHDGEANIYFCEICQATFKYNVDLVQHRKEHGGEETTAMVTEVQTPVETTTVYEIVEISHIG